MKFLFNRKKISIIIASIICIIAIITTSYRESGFITNITSFFIIPAQNLTTSVENFFSNRFRFVSVFELEDENEMLKQEIELLRIENNRIELLENDNIALRELLELQQRFPSFDLTSAEIIAKDNNNWNRSLIINKGLNHDIQNNMVVISSDGLVGRIVHTGNNFSRVMPVLDDNSSIGAKSLRTDDFGMVRGDLILSRSGLVKMELINLDSEILEGDEIVTSSLGTIFPPGLTIGHVKDIYVDQNNLTKTAIIQTSVDFSKIDKVLIITDVFIQNFEYDLEETLEN